MSHFTTNKEKKPQIERERHAHRNKPCARTNVTSSFGFFFLPLRFSPHNLGRLVDILGRFDRGPLDFLQRQLSVVVSPDPPQTVASLSF